MCLLGLLLQVLGVDDDDDNLNEGPYWKRKVLQHAARNLGMSRGPV